MGRGLCPFLLLPEEMQNALLESNKASLRVALYHSEGCTLTVKG